MNHIQFFSYFQAKDISFTECKEGVIIGFTKEPTRYQFILTSEEMKLSFMEAVSIINGRIDEA